MMNWLLLRGLAREQGHWYEFLASFEARVPGARVHCVDVAGAGTERAVLPLPSVRWMARDLMRRVPGLSRPPGAGERWSLLGLSLGGMLALELCRLLPSRLDSAVIVNASSRLTRIRDRLQARAALPLLRAALDADPLHREQIILALTSALPEAQRARHARRAAELARQAPASRRAVLAQLIAASRFTPPARALLKTRLAFVCSRHDQLVSPRCTRDLAMWYGCSWEEHPWAGHDLPLDDPEWLCEHVARLSETADAERPVALST